MYPGREERPMKCVTTCRSVTYLMKATIRKKELKISAAVCVTNRFFGITFLELCGTLLFGQIASLK